MKYRPHFVAGALSLALAAPLQAATQTFGIGDGAAALAARPQSDWVREAQTLERRGDWQGLLAWGRDWARIDAGNPLAWFIQGNALVELGRRAEAIAAYERTIRLAPHDFYAHNNLGNALRDSGRTREAMQAYRAAVEVNPDYVQGWHNIGLTFYRARGQAGVTRALQTLHATDPALAEVWRKLAVDYSITGDERIANEAVRVLRGLSPAERARMFRILFDGV